MTTAWNSVRAYADFHYKEDAGLLEAIPVPLERPADQNHIERADTWFETEVPEKARGMRHKILVIEGETGTGKTAYVRSKGTSSPARGTQPNLTPTIRQAQPDVQRMERRVSIRRRRVLGA